MNAEYVAEGPVPYEVAVHAYLDCTDGFIFRIYEADEPQAQWAAWPYVVLPFLFAWIIWTWLA